MHCRTIQSARNNACRPRGDGSDQGPLSGWPPPATRETVALASLEGDVHDLGKNIVKTVLLAKGYRVVDCGKDCPLETLIDKAEREGR